MKSNLVFWIIITVCGYLMGLAVGWGTWFLIRNIVTNYIAQCIIIDIAVVVVCLPICLVAIPKIYKKWF